MLIDFSHCKQLLQDLNIPLKGILHIGAHTCEEKDAYNNNGINNENIYWIEGNPNLVNALQNRGIPNVYQAVIHEEEKDIKFNISNNFASSSILEFGTHLNNYTNIYYTDSIITKTKRLDTLIKENNIPISILNFWNLDIQGAELFALKSAESFLRFVDAIYCEINIEHVYKDCPLITDIDAYLLKHGFVRLQTSIAPNVGWGDALYVRMLPTTIPE